MYTGSLAPFSNRAHWIIPGSLIDDDGEAVTLTDATLEFYITKQDCPETAELTATIANGKITLPTSTSFLITFTPDDVSDIEPGTYSAFMRSTISGETTQIMSATVACNEGGPES